MIGQLIICMASQTCIGSTKSGLIIIKIYKKKRKKRDKKCLDSNKQEANRAEILSAILLELEMDFSKISFRVHLSSWVLDQKLGTVQFRETHRDLEILSIKIES